MSPRKSKSRYSAPSESGSPVAGLLSLSTQRITNMSGVSVGRFGMVIRSEIEAASLFETTIVVMSGAAGFSPTESWYVVVLAATRVGAVADVAAPVAAAGRATAVAAARTSPRDTSMRTGPDEATDRGSRRQGRETG